MAGGVYFSVQFTVDRVTKKADIRQLQGSQVSCSAHTGFAAFSEGVQFIKGSPYAETKQPFRITSPWNITRVSNKT